MYRARASAAGHGARRGTAGSHPGSALRTSGQAFVALGDGQWCVEEEVIATHHEAALRLFCLQLRQARVNQRFLCSCVLEIRHALHRSGLLARPLSSALPLVAKAQGTHERLLFDLLRRGRQK